MFVKPKENLLVIDPATKKPLPPEGTTVTESSYWRRRIAAKDVSVGEPPVTAAKKES